MGLDFEVGIVVGWAANGSCRLAALVIVLELNRQIRQNRTEIPFGWWGLAWWGQQKARKGGRAGRQANV